MSLGTHFEVGVLLENTSEAAAKHQEKFAKRNNEKQKHGFVASRNQGFFIHLLDQGLWPI